MIIHQNRVSFLFGISFDMYCSVFDENAMLGKANSMNHSVCSGGFRAKPLPHDLEMSVHSIKCEKMTSSIGYTFE